VELVAELVTGSASPLAETVTALNHEAADHAVKDDPVVIRPFALLAGCGIGPLLRPSASPTKFATVFGASLSKSRMVNLPSVVSKCAYVPGCKSAPSAASAELLTFRIV
jgi:hypothetical protein